MSNNAIAVRPKIDIVLPADILDAQFDAAAPASRTVCYWMNGNASLKPVGGAPYLGGFALDAEKISPDQVDPKHWELSALTNRAGGEYNAFTAPVIHAALLGWREAWTEKETPEGVQPTYHRDYFPGSRSYVEIAAFVRGVSVPVVLTAKGMNSGKLKAVYAKAVADLRAAFGRPVPPYAFYLSIGGEVDKDGKPVLTSYGEGNATSSIIHIVPRWTISTEALKQATVPADVLELCKDFAANHLAQWKIERFQQSAADVVAEEGSF